MTRLYGSAFPRALPFSLFAGLLAGIIQAFGSKEFRQLWLHPYPYQSFAFIAGFMIVFRCALLRDTTRGCVCLLVSPVKCSSNQVDANAAMLPEIQFKPRLRTL